MMLVRDVVGEMGRFAGKMGQSVGEMRVGELSRRQIESKRIGYTRISLLEEDECPLLVPLLPTSKTCCIVHKCAMLDQ